MPTDIGPKIGIQGEAEFRRELQNINTGIKTLGSEMKVVTTAFLNNEDSVEALTAKNDVLARTVTSLNDRLELQKRMLAESAREYGAADEKTQKWQQAVNKTQAEINRYSAEIEKNNSAIDELGRETDDAADSVAELGDKGVTTGSLLKANLASEAIVAGVKALANAAREIVQALAEMVVNAARAADELNTMSKTTGLSTEELQKMQYASNLIDVSVDTLTGSMTKLTSNMYSARDGSGDAAEAFAALGIAVADSNGELRDRNEVFREAISALGQMTNETERDATAMKLFGRSAQDLNPLILAGADALEALGKEAENAGLILGQDDLSALQGVADAMDRFKATASAAGTLFMSAFAGPISESINQITGYVQRMTAAFSTGGWDALADEVGGALGEIGQQITEFLPKAVKFGAEILSNLILGIVDMLPEIIITGVEVGTSLLVSLSEGLTEAIPHLLEQAPVILDALVTSLIEAAPQLLDAAFDMVVTLGRGLVEHLPELIRKGVELVGAILEGIWGLLERIWSAGKDLASELAAGIAENLSLLLEKGRDLVANILSGIRELFADLWNAGKEVIDQVKAGVQQKIEDAKQWGRDLISNFIQGIKDMWESLKNTVAGVAQTVSDNLGFSEPKEGPLSNFHTFAPDMMQLYAQGIRENAWRVREALDDVTAGMSARIAAPQMSMEDMLAGTVNGMQTAVAGIGGGSYTFNLVLPDGTALARYQLPALIDVAQASGTPILNPV